MATAMMTATATTSPMVKMFDKARRVSTPLVAVETPDPAAAIEAMMSVLKKDEAALSWDCVRGVRELNAAGQGAKATAGLLSELTVNPVTALELVAKVESGAVLFFHNAQRFLSDPAVVQAIWNLRDVFKVDKRTLVLLGPAVQLPPELANDVIVLDEPLPTRAELDLLLSKTHEHARVTAPTGHDRDQALDALVGLPAYTAESVMALSMTSKGLDQSSLWDRKRKAIEQTDGLRVWRGGESFADLRGVDNAKRFMQRLVSADAFGVVVFIDEMDKALAGGMSDHSGDSGVAKDQVGTLLSYMQDSGSLGVMFAGIAGGGKSALAKATANQAGKVTIVLDLGAMKGGIVGSSEKAIRNALKVITATAEGRVLFIATANQTASFTPEMNRRFADQFFFDLPDRDGREAIWPVYAQKCSLAPEQLDLAAGADEGWTGAEIKRVCERAAMFRGTVSEAAEFMVPMAKSAKVTIEAMRRNAAGRFLSASRPGIYQPPDAAEATVARRFELD